MAWETNRTTYILTILRASPITLRTQRTMGPVVSRSTSHLKMPKNSNPAPKESMTIPTWIALFPEIFARLVIVLIDLCSNWKDMTAMKAPPTRRRWLIKESRLQKDRCCKC